MGEDHTVKAHQHGWNSVAKIKLSDGFPFHPKLSSWFSDYSKIPASTEIEVLEVSCGEASCPTEETLFVWEESGFGRREFRISRKKEKISKMDMDLSWKKFSS